MANHLTADGSGLLNGFKGYERGSRGIALTTFDGGIQLQVWAPRLNPDEFGWQKLLDLEPQDLDLLERIIARTRGIAQQKQAERMGV
jgi:hypothetical protein